MFSNQTLTQGHVKVTPLWHRVMTEDKTSCPTGKAEWPVCFAFDCPTCRDWPHGLHSCVVPERDEEPLLRFCWPQIRPLWELITKSAEQRAKGKIQLWQITRDHWQLCVWTELMEYTGVINIGNGQEQRVSGRVSRACALQIHCIYPLFHYVVNNDTTLT